MKTIQTPSVTILVVEVLPNAGFIQINKEGNLEYDPDLESVFGSWNTIKLPPGQWKLLGRRDEVTEEMAKGIVDKKEITSSNHDGLVYYDIYRNYMESEEYWKLSCDQCSNPFESFHSLLAANNITNNCLLLIEIK